MLDSRNHKMWFVGGIVSLSLIAAGAMLAGSLETSVDATSALPHSVTHFALLPAPQATTALPQQEASKQEATPVAEPIVELAAVATESAEEEAFEAPSTAEEAADVYEWIAIEGLDFSDSEIEALHDPYTLEVLTAELGGRFDLEVEFADCTKMPCILGGMVQHDEFVDVADADARLETFRSEVAASVGTEVKTLVASIILSDAQNTQAFIVSALPETIEAEEYEALEARFTERATSLLQEVDESVAAQSARVTAGKTVAGL